MTALPPEEVDDLERENARLKAELRAARDHQNASAEILKVIASSPSDVQPVLEAVADRAMSLLDAWSVVVTRFDGELLHFGAARGALPDTEQYLRNTSPMRPEAGIFAGRCIQERASINISDAQADPNTLVRERARLRGLRAALSVPMLRDGQPIGVITVSRREAGAFKANEVGLLQTFADQAVIAIENVRLFNETREALERQTATADILKVIASSPSDVQPVFDAIAELPNRLIGGHATSVLRFIEDRVELVAFTSVSPEADAVLKAAFPIPLKDYPILELVRGGEVAHVFDTETETRIPQSVKDLTKARGLRSFSLAPLMGEKGPIGVISVSRREPGIFAPHHVQLLQTFADQAVIAIQNARLFNETREALERQTATADILKVIASSPDDVQPVFAAIATNANRLIGGFSATVMLFVSDVLQLVAFTPTTPAADEMLQASFPRPLAEFPPFELVRDGETVQFPDTESEDVPPLNRTLARSRGYRGMLFTPLMNKGVAIGILSVTRKEPGAFAAHHVQLLQTFADQAVIAIENVRLFNETQEALERQTATADILKVIASSPSDVQPVFEAIARRANSLIGGFSSTVFRFIDGVAHLKAFTPTTAAADEVLRATFPRPVADFPPFQMAQAGEVTQIPDTEALSDDILNIARARGYRSMLFAPLINEGVSIGFIAVTRVQPGSFANHHVQLLQTFADQAVIAIENARLFEEVQAKTRDLTEALTYQTGSSNILRVIASSPTDVGPVLKAIVESACELCEAYDALVRLKDGNHLCFSAHHGPISASQEHFPINRNSTAGLAVIEQKPVHVHDLLSSDGEQFPDAQKRAQRYGHRTILSVPLLREGESIGAIILRRTEVNPFTDKQIALLQTFADQAVIAIGNVRLFDEVQARTRELSQSLDDLRAAQDRLVQTEKLASLGQLTAGIAHEIKNPLNFVNNFAALSAELTDELNDVLKPVTLAGKVREQVDELAGLLKDNLEKIVQHGKRADSIVKNMLLHSREGSGEHRPADINALLDESLNLAYHGARAEKPQFNVTLQRDFDDKAGMIELFPQEITRVFLNLISNGFYAVTKRKTENGGSGFEPVVSATTRDLGNTVEIRIRDNGTGIPAEVREKMFNPFFTTKPAGEGTGLGLSMSHDIIVKQHGGSIDVETEPGQFTEFRIILPRASNSSSKIRGQT
jgi:two-component system NtrC family sensor kinase